MPWAGVTTYGAITPALPPPDVMAYLPPSDPMTAMLGSRRGCSGSTPPSFLSSTVPASETSRPACAWPGVVTVAVSDPDGGRSNRPKRNISVRIRATMPSSVAVGTCPACTAALSGAP
jgi:hypothetical protein